MDSINIVSTLTKEDSLYNNSRPTNIVPTQHPTTPPLRLDTIHSPRREEFANDNAEVPTPESTTSQPPPPPPQEEKKMRWGLGRKLREKKDKK